MINIFAEDFNNFIKEHNIEINTMQDMINAIEYLEIYDEIEALKKHNNVFDDVQLELVHHTPLSSDEGVNLSKKEVCDLLGQLKKAENKEDRNEIIFLMANEINSAYKHLSLFYFNEKFLTDVDDFTNHIKESLLGFKYDLDKIVNDVIVNSFEQGNSFMDTFNTDNVLIVYNSVDNSGEVLKLDTMQDIAVFTKVISDLIKE
ncbi:hypothetical protein AM2_003 [Lactococcus phage AM2]|uniref:Uncharacterized protein n=8 Tax=Audreyjarvisvirus TaxID=2843351 RepID=A0A1W6JLF9_9CAUD|nr:hypothetical protein H1Z30_gp003 [Lactococcus phage AM1]YP_009905150.1 hypothetical protein H1Z34_gp003 [Lactococcus phage LW81]ARM66308.1 hypothetical protein AM2_003 [Lactococcus phage AM2]ARM66485.1 hypothetical protein AM3_003 [Lactococcus phage AM3]ARM67038.1 hypothetical protein AM8_003 [Lactococcus phage AM8]ARM67216.1 hypothetical protein AM9_003 [Lactococcus phage AM9]ARM67395.1 hypothetical protein AM11_003 [Lactococcus phage AM11]ARQ95582.1 hypothetical protein AM12_003 [Lactoc